MPNPWFLLELVATPTLSRSDNPHPVHRSRPASADFPMPPERSQGVAVDSDRQSRAPPRYERTEHKTVRETVAAPRQRKPMPPQIPLMQPRASFAGRVALQTPRFETARIVALSSPRRASQTL